jgi:alkylated DNA repair protein (DNA oxidative demethylase)
MRGTRIEIGPGIVLWREALDANAQQRLLREVLKRTEAAKFYRPRMPKSGKPFSVEMTNFGPLGWVSDEAGYHGAAMACDPANAAGLVERCHGLSSRA